MNSNVDLILEKLTIDKMGKSARKIHKNDIDKLLSIISMPGRSWNNRATYILRSCFGLFKEHRDMELAFSVSTKVDFADMKPDVKYDIKSNIFVFGVKASDFNPYSTVRVLADDKDIRRFLMASFRILAKGWEYEIDSINKEKGMYYWEDLDRVDKNYYAERFLDDYFTEDMKKMIKNFYPTYFEFICFMEHLSPRGFLSNSLLKDARVDSVEVYKAIEDMVYDFVVRRFIGVKIKDGYFKSLDIDDFLPVFSVDFDNNSLISNYTFRKTGLQAVKGKIDSGNAPRGVYYLDKVLNGGRFSVDYTGFEPDFLFSSDFRVIPLYG